MLIKVGYWDAIATSPYKVNSKNFKVANVLSETQFQFYLPANPGFDSIDHDPTRPFSPGYFGRIWQFGRLLIENNIIELGSRKLNGGYGRPIGVFLYVLGHAPQFIGRQAVIRDNV